MKIAKVPEYNIIFIKQKLPSAGIFALYLAARTAVMPCSFRSGFAEEMAMVIAIAPAILLRMPFYPAIVAIRVRARAACTL